MGSKLELQYVWDTDQVVQNIPTGPAATRNKFQEAADRRPKGQSLPFRSVGLGLTLFRQGFPTLRHNLPGVRPLLPVPYVSRPPLTTLVLIILQSLKASVLVSTKPNGFRNSCPVSFSLALQLPRPTSPHRHNSISNRPSYPISRDRRPRRPCINNLYLHPSSISSSSSHHRNSSILMRPPTVRPPTIHPLPPRPIISRQTPLRPTPNSP